MPRRAPRRAGKSAGEGPRVTWAGMGGWVRDVLVEGASQGGVLVVGPRVGVKTKVVPVKIKKMFCLSERIC